MATPASEIHPDTAAGTLQWLLAKCPAVLATMCSQANATVHIWVIDRDSALPALCM